MHWQLQIFQYVTDIYIYKYICNQTAVLPSIGKDGIVHCTQCGTLVTNGNHWYGLSVAT